MTKRVTSIAIAALCLLAILGAAYLVGYREGKRTVIAPGTRTVTDTVIVRDTLRIDNPVPVMTRVTDTMRIAIHTSDTLTVRDTLYIDLPREQKTYAGKDYRCQVSGYRPALDWVEVYPTTEYVTRQTYYRTRKWGFAIGAQLGYGYTPKGALPYIGAGVTVGYRF